MMKALRKSVLKANLALPKKGLVTLTWGNASQRDPKSGLIAIKPSGIAYGDMRWEDIVVVDLSGSPVLGSLRPSSDLQSHLALYQYYPELGGIIHTHATHATAWAQAGRDIPLYGTTHADYFKGFVPCTRQLTAEEVERDYELNTGLAIIEVFEGRGLSPLHCPAVLCHSHGVFTFGQDAKKALDHAIALEAVAQMAMMSEALRPGCPPAPDYLRDKHFYRKHGENAYYGQSCRNE